MDVPHIAVLVICIPILDLDPALNLLPAPIAHQAGHVPGLVRRLLVSPGDRLLTAGTDSA
jgi:hypothetical protein